MLTTNKQIQINQYLNQSPFPSKPAYYSHCLASTCVCVPIISSSRRNIKRYQSSVVALTDQSSPVFENKILPGSAT